MSHQIPIVELYRIIDTCSNSEDNIFCAILIKIESRELQKKYQGFYLLQVWTSSGIIAFSKTLQFPLHLWNLNGKHLLFIQNEREPVAQEYRQFQQIYIVKLHNDRQCEQAIISTLIFKFYSMPLDQFYDVDLDTQLSFTDDHLIVATHKMLKYCEVGPEVFEPSHG